MDPSARFTEVVGTSAEALPLDEAALLIAAHAEPDIDVAAYLARLDELAAACPAPTLDALVRHLFGRGRFSGNEADYYDPRNSFLNHVLDRGLGIPITLAVLTMEVGRRLGVPLWGVGMPGHFLLRDKVDPSVFVDPFHGGRLLDAAGCERLYRRLAGPDAAWDPSFLDPMPRPLIVARLLNNLRGVYERRRDLSALQWVMRLRCTLPDAGPDLHHEFALAMAPLN